MICCAVIGVIMYMLSAHELRATARTEQYNRLILSAEDMDAQLDQLQTVSVKIQNTIYYAPTYFKRNAYYELELLEDMQKYANYSTLPTHFFVRYTGEDAVYSEAGKSFLKEYAKTYLLCKAADAEALRTYLDACSEPGVFDLPGGVLVTYPITFSPSQMYADSGTVCFYLTDQMLRDRVELIFGQSIENLKIEWRGAALITGTEMDDPLTAGSKRAVITLDTSEIGFHVEDGFVRMSILLVCVFAALLCLLAATAAVRSYRPIGNIARRHNLHEDGNELEHLDRALSDTKSQLRISQEQLDEKLQQLRDMRDDLRRHFSVQLVQGSADEASLERMREAGMNIPGQRFGAYILKLKKSDQDVNVEQAINELSDEMMAFYAVPYGGENSYAVVVNADQLEAAGDILRDACAGAAVFGGEQTEVLSEIPSLLFDALTDAAPSCIRPSDIARCREDERLRQLRKALEAGDETLALQCLREYCAAYDQDDQMMRNLMHNNVLSVLLAASYDANMNVPRTFLRGGDETFTMLEGWVSALCGNCENMTKNEEHQIIRYLREHALDYSLMLEGVAEHFHRSTRQITRIIQAETGGGYKDFILRQRMEHAKKMLREGKSVAETCEKVCYVSRSHFIKSFTNYTGMTPSRYREQEEEQ